MIATYRLFHLHNVQKHFFRHIQKSKHTSSKCLQIRPCLPNLRTPKQLKFVRSLSSRPSRDSAEYGFFGLRMKTSSDLMQLANDAISYSENSVEKLLNRKNGSKNEGKDNVSKRALYVIDDVSNVLCSIADPSELLRHVHKEEEWRNAANTCIEKISEFIGKININKEIYELLSTNYEKDVNQLNEEERLVLRHMIESMEHQGVHLTSLVKDEYLNLLQEELVLSFSIIDSNYLKHQPAELPKEVKIPADPQLYQQLLKNSEYEDLRRRIWQAQRKSDQESLLRILELRSIRTKLSQIRGFKNYLEYSQKECILNGPAVESFLLNCTKLLEGRLKEDWEELSRMKRESEKGSKEVLPWDVDYLINKKRSESRVYLSLSTVIQFFRKLLNELFEINLVMDKSKEVKWDDKVIKYNLVDHEGTVAHLYLDLFERPNKTTICAQFTIRCSKSLNNNSNNKGTNGNEYVMGITKEDNFYKRNGKVNQVPSTVIVASFHLPEGRVDQESNGELEGERNLEEGMLKRVKVDLSNCEILFHELGHTLHTLLSETDLQHLSGNRGPIDFAEFSSHLFELFFQSNLNEMLKIEGIEGTFSEEEVKSYKKFESIDLGRMVILSKIDQRFYANEKGDDWEEMDSKTSYEKVFEGYEYLNEKVGEFNMVQMLGTPALTNFDHLVHYGGNYYCYLYSRMLALKVYKSFEGLKRSEVGGRLLEFFKKGSVDSTINPINRLAGRDLSEVPDSLFLN